MLHLYILTDFNNHVIYYLYIVITLLSSPPGTFRPARARLTVLLFYLT